MMSNDSDRSKRVYTKRTEDKVRRWSPEETLLYEKFIEMYALSICYIETYSIKTK